jgi:hypothetical protein
MMTATSDMAALFAGHTGAYFSQHPSPRCVRRPVTLGLIHDHLYGEMEIGTYPVRSGGTCRWGCIDIDVKPDSSTSETLDSYRPADTAGYGEALDIQRAWTLLGVTSWLERSRSKGWHVWVFADRWVRASVMRDAGLLANHVSDVNADEVNPKNAYPWTTSNGLVNTVRMPYPAVRNAGRMTVVDPDDGDLTLEQFTRRAMASRTPVAALEAAAVTWRRTHRKSELRRSLDTGEHVPLGTGRQDAAQVLAGSRRVVKGERDNQFYAIARYLHARGIPHEQALVEVERVWRTNCDTGGYDLRTALEKVERTYR